MYSEVTNYVVIRIFSTAVSLFIHWLSHFCQTYDLAKMIEQICERQLLQTSR